MIRDAHLINEGIQPAVRITRKQREQVKRTVARRNARRRIYAEWARKAAKKQRTNRGGSRVPV